MKGYKPLFWFHLVIRWHSVEIPLALHILNNVPISVEAEGCWLSGHWRTNPLGCVGSVWVWEKLCASFTVEELRRSFSWLWNIVPRLSFSYCDKDLELVRFPIITNMCCLIYCLNMNHIRRKWLFFIKRSAAMSWDHYVGHYSSCFLSSGIDLAQISVSVGDSAKYYSGLVVNRFPREH